MPALRGSASCLSHPVPLSPAQLPSPSPIHPALQGFGDRKSDDAFEDRLGDDGCAMWEHQGHGKWASGSLQGIPKCHLQFGLVPLVLGCSGCLTEGQWDTIPSPEAEVEAL